MQCGITNPNFMMPIIGQLSGQGAIFGDRADDSTRPAQDARSVLFRSSADPAVVAMRTTNTLDYGRVVAGRHGGVVAAVLYEGCTAVNGDGLVAAPRGEDDGGAEVERRPSAPR